MHRTTRSLAALAFALAALAAAPARADVVVEDLQTPPGVDQWERAPQGPPPPRSRAIATLAFYGSGVRPRALNLRLVDPEVALVDGLALPPGAFADRANQGGFTYGAGYDTIRMRTPCEFDLTPPISSRPPIQPANHHSSNNNHISSAL